MKADGGNISPNLGVGAAEDRVHLGGTHRFFTSSQSFPPKSPQIIMLVRYFLRPYLHTASSAFSSASELLPAPSSVNHRQGLGEAS